MKSHTTNKLTIRLDILNPRGILKRGTLSYLKGTLGQEMRVPGEVLLKLKSKNLNVEYFLLPRLDISTSETTLKVISSPTSGNHSGTGIVHFYSGRDKKIDVNFAGNVLALSTTIDTRDWIINTGVIDHVRTAKPRVLHAQTWVKLPSGQTAQVICIGQVHLHNGL
ncbi:LOW QUALITY PROTEIN: hypothetical protein Cgig2_027708 [Carnegiea gigantea]|uniref:Uncharacterized protein n=1 Tax=Carnegiea gigantea TaxID=171969 RepID=A0A9Q1JWC8_9CARY|nr:LOW QUALITY PROTEIN: hypothetical protein Cgig2_027708 [Carnegiea gigantea]